MRPGALAVLSHMLLSFQHSPEAFHLVSYDKVSTLKNLVLKFYFNIESHLYIVKRLYISLKSIYL